MRHPVPLLAFAAVVCALVVAGCTNNPEASPSTSVAEGSVTPAPLPTIPTPTDPRTIHEQNAIADYERYIDAFNRYYQNGAYDDLQASGELGSLVVVGPSLATTPTGQSLPEFAMAMRSAGARQEGEITVRSPQVIQYTPDPHGNEMDSAVLEICYDASSVRYVSPDGTQLAVGNKAFVATVTMRLQPQLDGSDFWQIVDQINDWERPCS